MKIPAIRLYDFLVICLLGLLVTLAACGTKTYGVVTDVTPTESGLVITKCDEQIYFNYAYIIVGQGNCRVETQGITQ